jgi:hypothetical protein
MARISTTHFSEVASGPKGRPARPPPLPISQSAKSAEKGAYVGPPGYDAGKKIKGNKRHILLDRDLLLHAIVHRADIQDRDGGNLVRANFFGMFPFLKKLFPDGGYHGPQNSTRLWPECSRI